MDIKMNLISEYLPSTAIETQPMDDSLEHIFISMMHQGEILEAVEFIRSIDTQYIPSQVVMQTLIFHVLMKSSDVKCLSKVSAYLVSVINVYPPNNEEARKFYHSSIVEADGYLSDLWNVFCHIVNSYFCHHEIYVTDGIGPDAVKFPNCKFLLEFYIKLFSVDFDHLNNESYKSCLVMHLLWPGGDACMTSRTENLLRWINDTYSSPYVNQWAHLLKSMHELLMLMVKCIIHGKHNLVEVAAFNDPSLTDVCEDITNFCKNAYSTLPNLKLFFSFLSLQCLRAKVSEKIIRLITKQTTRPYSILTLKEIVNQHMFPHRFNKWKNKPVICKAKNLRKRTGDKSIDKSKMETTQLHRLCEENKFADLMISLKNLYEHINTRDPSGCTPLYKACQAKHYMCVKVLINEAGKTPVPKLDVIAANLDGKSPLHLAVTLNSLEIARMLLDCGGSSLLSAVDSKGQRPADLDCSEEMEKLLKEYQTETMDTDDLDSFVEESQVKEAPTLKSFKEYSIYLHALNCLLCSYANLFQLHNLAWKKNTFIQNHSEKMCSHFVNDNFACSEDAALLSELPELIETFIQSLYKNVSKLNNVNIDLELLPLKAFKTSIQYS